MKNTTNSRTKRAITISKGPGGSITFTYMYIESEIIKHSFLTKEWPCSFNLAIIASDTNICYSVITKNVLLLNIWNVLHICTNSLTCNIYIYISHMIEKQLRPISQCQNWKSMGKTRKGTEHTQTYLQKRRWDRVILNSSVGRSDGRSIDRSVGNIGEPGKGNIIYIHCGWQLTILIPYVKKKMILRI